MDKDQRDHQFYYRCEMQWHSHYEPLDYQILIYERHGLVPRDQDIKPTKEREVICFPWQGLDIQLLFPSKCYLLLLQYQRMSSKTLFHEIFSNHY